MTVGPEPPPNYDGWELEEQLRHIERVLAPEKSCGNQPAEAADARRYRLDSAHSDTCKRHVPPAKLPQTAPGGSEKQTSAWLPLTTWAVLSLGLMAFACGGVLVAWSMVTGRQDLWGLGLPIALAGQIFLLIGLILQLDRLWHDNRSTASKLVDVDQRLAELNTTTSLLGTSHGSAASSFYCHMAGGADPQLLLADLKGQLDLLALRLARVKH